MKPWFNTSLILMLTVIWVIIGWQLHKRLSNVELMLKIKGIEEITRIQLQDRGEECCIRWGK